MMLSIILRTATRFILPLLLLFSIFLLLRGHNEPGGGFAGGLVAASAFVLYALAYNLALARKAIRIEPRLLVGSGLLTAAASGMPAVTSGNAFMTGLWGSVSLPGGVVVTLGTPLLFDLGVYLVVVGVTLMILLNVAEE